MKIQLTPDDSNLQVKSKEVQVIGSRVIKGKISNKVT